MGSGYWLLRQMILSPAGASRTGRQNSAYSPSKITSSNGNAHLALPAPSPPSLRWRAALDRPSGELAPAGHCSSGAAPPRAQHPQAQSQYEAGGGASFGASAAGGRARGGTGSAPCAEGAAAAGARNDAVGLASNGSSGRAGPVAAPPEGSRKGFVGGSRSCQRRRENRMRMSENPPEPAGCRRAGPPRNPPGAGAEKTGRVLPPGGV